MPISTATADDGGEDRPSGAANALKSLGATVGVIRGRATAITDADDAFLAMVGWSRNDFERGLMDWAAMTPEEYLPLDLAGIKQAAETGGFTVPYQKEFYRRDGSRVPVLLACAFVPHAEGAWIGYVVDLSATRAGRPERDDAFVTLAEQQLPQFFLERLIAELVRERGRMVRMLDSTDALIWAVDVELRLLSANAAFQQAYRALRGHDLAIGDRFLAPDLPDAKRAMWEDGYRRALAGERNTLQAVASYPDGDRAFESFLTPMHAPNGELLGVTVVSRDVTQQREMELRLRQAHKMEAIGQLAGGVAHDFNNLLTVIGGSLDFARESLPAGHEVRTDLDEIAAATDRARALVRQLLTFSRKQPVQPRVVQVGEVIRGMEQLLRRVIGEEIALEVLVDQGKPPVLIDPVQLEQVVMNLAVNARDALLTPQHGFPGTGGSLYIEASARQLEERDRATWGALSPGRYVQVTVRDTGHGMDEATRARLFEPFFTTKDVGVGTGLGLATVYGIVRQAGGAIRVESAPGAGSAFTILLPAAEQRTEATTPTTMHVEREGTAQATVLLVEDERPVRAIVRRTLERRGYTVLEARHGADALMLWRTESSRIDVVITDLRMPEMGGRALVQRLRAERPGLPAVYVSGYTDEETTPLGAQDRFVEKPFSAEVLLGALRELLGA